MIERSMCRSSLIAVTAAASLLIALPAGAQVDEDAAKLLFKQNECSKCHNPDKAKKGPSLRKIAKDNKGDEKKLIQHLTVSKKVKLDDGTEEDHKVVDSKDQKAISNLAKWILAH
jgi:cytochrome c